MEASGAVRDTGTKGKSDAPEHPYAGAGAMLAAPALAQGGGQGTPLRLGLMLPFSGTFAALGENIAAAMRPVAVPDRFRMALESGAAAAQA